MHPRNSFCICHSFGIKLCRNSNSNSSEKTFEENITNFKRRLRMRGYRDRVIDKHLSEVKHHERMSALQNKTKTHKKILPFMTEYRPGVPNLKKIIMHKWYLIENQPLLREIFKDPPIISYKRGKSLQNILVRAKL